MTDENYSGTLAIIMPKDKAFCHACTLHIIYFIVFILFLVVVVQLLTLFQTFILTEGEKDISD